MWNTRSLLLACLLLGALAPRAGAWTTATDLTNMPDYECAPRIERDSLNNVHMVWFGGADDASGWRIYYQKYNGVSWTSPVSISGSNASTPDIAVDGANNLHAVWHAGGNPEDIYYRKCTSGVWGGTVNISNSGARSLAARIALDPSATSILVVWHEGDMNGGNWDIAAKKCTNGVWGNVENASDDGSLSRTADVDIDSSGNYHVAWEDTDTSHLYYNKRLANGTWAGKINLDTTSGRSYGASVAVSANNYVHVVWHDDNTDWDIHYRCHNGSSWGSDTNISNNPGVTDCGAAVDTDSNNDAFVSWHDYDHIYYRHTKAGVWRPWYMLADGDHQTTPCVLLDGANRCHVVWQSRMPGSWDVMWNRQDADVTPPPVVTSLTSSGSNTKVYLNWHNPSGADFVGVMIRYRTDRFPTSISDGTLLSNIAGSPGSNGSYVHTGLPNGVTYYYSLFAYDTEPNYAAPAGTQATTALLTCGTVKQRADGLNVDLLGKVVTAIFSTEAYIYVQEPGRVSGIRVANDGSGLALGNTVDVSGIVTTITQNGYPAERQISNATVTWKTSGTASKPLAMSCGAVGGAAVAPDMPGVAGGVGLNSIGQLARIAGMVTLTLGNYVYIDDGSNIDNGDGTFGVMVESPSAPTVIAGNVVSATGIVQGNIPAGWTESRRYIKLRAAGDLALVSSNIGAISGYVTDSSWNGVPGATVSTTSGGYSATTNSTGAYTLNGVIAGRYTVKAGKLGYTTASQDITLAADQNLSLDIVIDPNLGSIQGLVRDSNMVGISGATVTTSTGGYTATTNSSGGYTISGVAVGTYGVTASKVGYISQTLTGKSVSAGNVTYANFVLAATSGTITGTVKDSNNALISGASVSTSAGGYTATTNGSGVYTLTNVTAGTYSVTASRAGYSPQTLTGIVVTAGNATTCNLVVTSTTGTIAGTVTASGGGAISGATVSTTSGGYTATTNGSGGYTLLSVTPGTYSVVASVSGYAPGTNTGVAVTAGSIATSNFVLTSSFGSISGTVTASGGGALSGATVSTATGGYTATTNVGGGYTLSSVSPGTYSVTAAKTGYVSQTNTGVVVTAGNAAASSFSLILNSGTITGTVTASGGGALSGATVSTTSGGYSATTNASGGYTLSSITAGTYSVTASKTGYTSQTNTGVVVTAGGSVASNFALPIIPTEKITDGNMEGGFYNTGWAATCSDATSQLPNPSGSTGWGWNNVAGVPFNTFDEAGVKHAGSHALGFAFCQTAASPGKMGIASQTVYIGAMASAVFSAWARHTDGNCPSIMCWNPGTGQNDPMVANSAGHYQWVTTDNWGQVNTWVTRSMTITADATGNVTIMVGGSAHSGTGGGAKVYIDDVSVQ